MNAREETVSGEQIPIAGTILGGLWIFGGALYFFVHFSRIFYEANKGGIDNMLEALGLGG